MKLTTVREIYKNHESFLEQEVTIGGWVRSNRDSKSFGFLSISDGSYFEQIQVVYHDAMKNFAEIAKTNIGAALIVSGKLVATPNAKQPFEIQANDIQVEGVSSLIILFKRSATHLNICVQSLIFVLEPICSRLCLECVL